MQRSGSMRLRSCAASVQTSTARTQLSSTECTGRMAALTPGTPGAVAQQLVGDSVKSTLVPDTFALNRMCSMQSTQFSSLWPLFSSVVFSHDHSNCSAAFGAVQGVSQQLVPRPHP